MIGKTLRDDDTTYMVEDTREGTHGIVLIIKDTNGDLWEVQDQDVAADDKGELVIVGEIWPA